MRIGIAARTGCSALLGTLLASCAPQPSRTTSTDLEKIQHIVVIYAENRSFDNLYGLFPGADGIANATPSPSRSRRSITTAGRYRIWRVPALVISPYARRHYIDHTQYDTTSILKFITRRFALEPLPGVRPQMGDLTAAFDLSQ